MDSEPLGATPLLWPLVLYLVAVLAIVGGMIVISSLLGQRHNEPSTGVPFESGVLPTGPARQRVTVNFYLMAMFFVIFDMESVFLFAWAVAARPLGWAGLIEAVVFIVILLAALVYLWGQGALDWAAAPLGEGGAAHPGRGGAAAVKSSDEAMPVKGWGGS